MTDKGGGLVKKLLFPGYTDAGSNETFHAPAAAATRSSRLEDTTTQSEATTAVYDNRAASKPQQHEVQYDGDRVGGYAPSSSTVLPSARSSSQHINDSMNTETGISHAETNGTTETRAEEPPSTNSSSSRTARLFPSTDPSTNIKSGMDNSYVNGPASPPKMVRRAPPSRDLSTRAITGATVTMSPRTMPFPTTSPRIRPVEPLIDLQDTESSLEQSSMAVTSVSSEVASSVLGYHFLDQSKEEDSNDAAGSTPVKSNLSRQTSGDFPESRPLTLQTLKEMEPQGDGSGDGLSDVNSNVSEYGTVIEAPGRLAEVQAMASLIESRENAEISIPLTPMKEEEPHSFDPDSAQSHLFAPDELESVALTSEVAGLALPTLDTRPGDDTEGIPKPLLLSSSPRSFKENDEQNVRSPRAQKNETIPDEEANQPNTSASAMVSAAFRRLGSGVGSLSQTMRSPIPTPTPGTTAPPPTPPTPRPDYTRQRSSGSIPSSFLLRSPGSAAHFTSEAPRHSNSSHRRNPILSPRYRDSGSIPRPQQGVLRHANSLASPLRFARGCFSFDTSVPDDYHVHQPIPEGPSSKWQSNDVEGRNRSLSWDAGSSVLAAPGQDGPFSSRDFRSLGIGSVGSPGKSNASAFRAPLTRGGTQILHRSERITSETGEFPAASTPSRGGMRNAFSPAIVNTRDAIPLRTPNRIEIEREDALDILACLVQRSAEFEREKTDMPSDSPSSKSPNNEDDDTTGTSTLPPEDDGIQNSDDDDSTSADTGGQKKQSLVIENGGDIGSESVVGSVQSESGASEISEAVRLLREISETYQREESKAPGSSVDHEARMSAIDELLRSHTYASEMKRAATSASAWLRSIGREETAYRGSEVADNSEKLDKGNDEAMRSTETQKNIDLVAVNAMLHAAEMKTQEKGEAVQRLNDELSKCRAEIGRLKSSSRAEVIFASPNRSILDNDSTTSSEDASKVDAEVGALEEIVDDASPILEASGEASGEGYTSFEASFVHSEQGDDTLTPGEVDKWETLASARRDIVMLKASLLQANDTIKTLQAEIRNGNQSKGEEEGEHVDGTVITTENPELAKELDEYKDALQKAVLDSQKRKPNEKPDASSGSPDKRTINVRMLDGENFITEWDELTPPLPPPPDHGLRSPIVKDLLEQWTSDESLQASLLSWMDRVLDGTDPQIVPPLTISSLNHQVRDGFTMHVLPLLLRRSDIHLEVTTRAHRTTTYDLAIKVSSSMPTVGAGIVDDQSQASSNSNVYAAQRTNKTHMMAFKASHGDNPIVEASMELNAKATGLVADYLRSNSNYSQSFENGSDSVAHSAVTDQITNSYRTRPIPPRPPTTTSRGSLESDTDHFASYPPSSLIGDEGSVGSSISRSSSHRSREQQQQPGLMSTIGGALGLISRRKPPPNQASIVYSPSYDDENWNSAGTSKASNNEDVPSFLKPPLSPHGPPRSHDDGEDQPYHRVVSAPPGRIGVTFVEYRGHAVVSDVARDSPLSGWVFPSDILIAIDEVPVSGMRVRDIVNILTGRKERQRALRVISSHAMNEALNASAVSEVNAS